MSKEIILKTDASYKRGVGCAVSYNVKIDWEGDRIQYKNSKFTHGVKDSTHAELVGAVYGIVKTFKTVKDASEYSIKIGTDCEYVVETLNKRFPEQPKIVKIALNILDQFKEWSINWIPRVKNGEADALARSELMKHE